MSEPLDMPDGPGWWGHDHNEHLRLAIHLPVFYLKNNMVHYQWGDDEHYRFVLTPKQFRFAWPGKWYRLTMPWDEAQPAIPPDVRETLREALEWRKQWMKATGDQLTVNSIDEVNAALSWLDAA